MTSLILNNLEIPKFSLLKVKRHKTLLILLDFYIHNYNYLDADGVLRVRTEYRIKLSQSRNFEIFDFCYTSKRSIQDDFEAVKTFG